jgi:hypothetical protein
MKVGEVNYKSSEDFSLEINYYRDPEDNTQNKYYVCLKCINPECLSVNKKLEEEFSEMYDLNDPLDREQFEREICIIKIELTIMDKIDTLTSNTGEEFVYRINLDSFYNNATKYGRGVSYLNPKLKGAGAALMFILLKTAIINKKIKEDDTIVLLASGDLDENEDMRRLIEYYEKLGFDMINPESLEEDLESVTMSVPMKGKVEDVLNRTMARFPMISKEFLNILKKLI